MKKLNTLLMFPLLAVGANAATVALTPGDINGLDTTTTNFSDGDVTITPFVGGTASTFNANADRLGIDGTGSNANAFNDPDVIAGNGNDETLQLAFSANAGLTELSWDFARADGPLATDGISITGFTADPNATLTGPGTFDLDYDAGTGTLSFQISGAGFTGTDGVLTLDGVASAGQTLEILVNDSTQAGAQLPITGISYDNAIVAVPEPSSTALIGLAGLSLILRRKR